MSKNYVAFKITLFVTAFLINVILIKGQCGFSGLNPNYCANSLASTLTPVTGGGIFIGAGITGTNVFNPSIAGPGTHTINYSLCTATYAISSPPFAPSFTTGTPISLGDDQESAMLPIGFSFKYFCTPYTDFYISSNGFIEFALTGNGCCAGQALPNNNTPSNLIAYCWTDLYPPAGGSITYTTIGAAPNRTLVVSFVGINHFNGGQTLFCCPITSQIKLFETSNIIEIHTTTKPLPTASYLSTMGISSPGGSLGYPVTGRNATNNWTATNECYRWTPGTPCSLSQTTTVSPAIISVVGNPSICIGGTANLTAGSNTTYTWSTGSNAAVVALTPTSNTTYTVGGTNSFGCIANSAITVTVDNTPTVTVSSSNGTGGSCPSTPLTLTAVGATSYTWTNNVINGVAFTPTVSNIYTVTGSNACGSTTAAISISVHPLPLITVSVNNPTICSGSSVILIGTGGIGSFTWNPGITNNGAFFPTATQNYTVKGVSVLGCTAQAVQGVTVITTPSITPIVTPTAICVGGSAVLSAIGATGFTWTPGTSLNASTTTVSPQITTTYTLFRTNGACSNTSTVTLIVNPLPVVMATASPSQICAGDGSSILIAGPATNTTFPPGFTASNFMIYPNSSVTYTVVGSSGSCTASAVLTLIVNPRPVISITIPTNTICEGQSINLTANGTTNLTFTWAPSGNMNSITETATPATTTIITLSATNASNCTGSVSQLIVVNPVPNMSLVSTPGFVCANQQAVISVVNPSTMCVYNWSTGGTGTSIQSSASVTTIYVATGVNTVTGCQNSNTLSLAVYISTFAITSPTALCKGQTATLTASGPATTYFWTANGGITAPSITVSPLTATVYSVTGTNGSCNNTQTLNLIVNPTPNVTAFAAKSQICRFEVSTIIGNGATSYSWNTGASTPTISFTLSLTTTYTLTGTDANFCSKTVTVSQFVATCIGVEDQSAFSNGVLNVYPNPNSGNFTISSDVDITVSIVNTLGQVVHRMSLKENNNPGSHREVTVSSLPTGIYFITGLAQGLKVNKKIIVER